MARLCSACFFPANRRQAGAVTGKIYKKHPRTRERRSRQCEQENTKRLKVLRSLLSAQNSRERRTVFPVNTGDLQAIYRKRLSLVSLRAPTKREKGMTRLNKKPGGLAATDLGLTRDRH